MGITRHVPPPEPVRVFHASALRGDVTRDVGVIIVAAGAGTRMGGDELKQFRWIGGKPMLMHSVEAFMQRADVCAVVCVLPRQYVADPPPWLLQRDLDRLLLSVGGATRSESVRNGLEDLAAEARFVLVHDAARPFVPQNMIDRVVEAMRSSGAAVPALPVSDTLKRAGADGVVHSTVSRDALWRAQTPQGFERTVLERAHREAQAAGVSATDDAALVESLGVQVRLVPGDERALKITAPADFALAEALRTAGRTP
jgi:2-C-methyl-D-erythritol 4-phosphate cytidylyltransferase